MTLATRRNRTHMTSRLLRRELLPTIALACAASSWSSDSRADNPIVQTIYTADPAPMVHGGRVYVYAGHDEDTLVNNFFTMNEWRVYSSADMVNWTDHGTPLKYTDFSWARSNAWASQAVFRNGQFYFYVTTAQGIGVAVSTSPAGPFKDALGKALISNSGCGDIDPTAFVDDDGQAYLYWGNPSCCYVKLNTDMISYSGGIVKVPMTTASFGTRSNTDRATSYEEAPWLYKRGSLYYLVFAGGPISEHIAYSTSSSPTGPWTYRGVIMPTQGASFTNHPGIIDFEGNSYFVYHNGALPGGGGYHRSVAIERFNYNADGTIPKINMTTVGAPGIGSLNPYTRTEAETIAWESGVETEICSEGGMNVTSISSGDYIKVKNVDFGGGATAFTARVAAAAGGGTIQIRLGSQTGTLVGSCPVTATGGSQIWADTTCTISGASGIKDLFFVFAGSAPFAFDHWKFSGIGAGTGGNGGSSGGAPGAGGTSPSGGSGGRAGAMALGGSTTTGGSAASGGRVAEGGATSAGGATIALTGGAASATMGGRVQTGGTSNGGTIASSGGVATGGGTAPDVAQVGSGGAFAAGGRQAGGDPIALGGAVISGSSATALVNPPQGDGCGCRVVVGQASSRSVGALGLLGLAAILQRRLRRGAQSRSTVRAICHIR